MDILGIAQQGLQQAQGQVEKSAARIAQVSLNAAPSQPDSVSLSDQVVALMSGANQFQADLGLARTANEMQKQTLDLLA